MRLWPKRARSRSTSLREPRDEGFEGVSADPPGYDDGEVCITALETGLTGTFRLTVRKDLGYTWPFAELMTIGLHESLDEAMRQTVREMVRHVCARTGLTRNQAYMLCSLAGNLRITQTVDGNKGVHMLMPKSALPAKA